MLRNNIFLSLELPASERFQHACFLGILLVLEPIVFFLTTSQLTVISPYVRYIAILLKQNNKLLYIKNKTCFKTVHVHIRA